MQILTQKFPLTPSENIPAVGFGTYLISDTDAEAAVRTAIGLGYRHVDTAAVYQNERAVGAGLRAGLEAAGLAREDVFVTTKLWPGHAGWGEPPKTEEQTISECQISLEKLSLDYVDLYLIHSPHGGAERLAQWRGLLELKRTGKARSVGVSNFNTNHLAEIEAAGLELPDANQIELHPWSQKPELIAYMREKGIAPIAYSSLAPLSTWRTAPGQDSAKTSDMSTDVILTQMAEKYGVSQAQLLLRWGVQNGYAVLPKSLSADRMKQNIELSGFAIDADDMAMIETLDRGDGLAWSVSDPIHFEG